MVIPWKIEDQNNNNANTSKPKSIMQSRIAAIKALSEKENLPLPIQQPKKRLPSEKLKSAR